MRAMFAAIFNPLVGITIETLKFFYSLVPNYGLAIIFVTMLVKIALYPLTLQSTKSMAAMQKIQPKLQELQKKHKGDPKEIQRRTMELYQEEGVNPFGGCLPMLLQLPIFIALFFALNSPEFKAILAMPGIHGGFLWVKNLAEPEFIFFTLFGLNLKLPTFAILIGLSTYWSQRTIPQQKGSGTQPMIYFMPFFIAYISLYFPAGVQIYWLTQTAITALQQAYILKKSA